MADPTLVNGGVTFTFYPGSIKSLSVDKLAGLDVNALPISDSDETFINDFNGTLKTITITGTLTPETSSVISPGSVTSVTDQINWIEALINGNQSSSTFTSLTQSAIKVYIQRFNYQEEQGYSDRVTYTLTLLEGDGL